MKKFSKNHPVRFLVAVITVTVHFLSPNLALAVDITVSGTVYTDEGTTVMTSTPNITVYNASTADQESAAANGSGVYSISGVSVTAADQRIFVWINDETELGNTLTTTADGSSNISNLDIYEDYVIIQTEGSGNYEAAWLSSWDNGNDADMLYDVPGANVFESGSEAFIPSGETLDSSLVTGTQFADFDCNGTINMEFFASISGDADYTGCTVSDTTAEMRFVGTSDQTLTTGGVSMGSIRINNSGTDGSDDNIIVSGALDIISFTGTDGDLDVNTNSVDITVSGNWTMGSEGTLDEGTQTVTFDGADDQSITSAGEAFYNVTINNTGTDGSSDFIELQDDLDVNGTLTITNGDLDMATETADITVAGDITISAGNADITPGTQTVTLDGAADQDITSNSEDFHHLTINNTGTNGSNDDIILIDNMSMTGTLIITDGDLDLNTNTADLQVNSDMTIGANGSLDEGTQTITFGGLSVDTTLTSHGESFPNVTCTKNAGIELILADDLDVNGTLSLQNNCDLDLITNDADLNITGSFAQISVNALLLIGDETVTFDGGTTQSFNVVGGAMGGTGADDVNFDFYNITITNNSTLQISASDEMEVDGTLTINSGSKLEVGGWTLDLNGTLSNDGTLEFDGDELGVEIGTMDTDSGTVSYVGDGDGTGDSVTINDFGTPDYFNLVINDASATSDTFQLGAALDVQGSLTVTDGTLDSNSNNINVGASWAVAVAGDFTEGTDTVTFDAGSGSQTITNNSESFYNVVFDDSAGTATWTLEDAMDISNDFTLTDGIFDTNSSEDNALVIDRDILLNGGTINMNDSAITVTRNWTNAGTTQNPGDSTVTFNPVSANSTITSNGESFDNLVFDDLGNSRTVILADTLDADGNLTHTSGILFPNSNDINLAGNWSNSATFTSGTMTVTLDGSGTQNITAGGIGSGQNFNTLEVTNSAGTINFLDNVAIDNFVAQTPGSTLTVEDTATMTVGTSLTMQGGDTNEITLQSDDGTLQFDFAVPSGSRVFHINVNDSNASTNSIRCHSCTNGGDNDDGGGSPRWSFHPIIQPLTIQ